MTYLEFVKQREQEVNQLPIKYAFNNEQFEDIMAGWGLTSDDTDKIYRLGDTGGFYLKEDAERIREYFKGGDKLRELMQDKDFRREAFRYEMDNHEYFINWEADWEVCGCFLNNIEYADGKDYEDYLREAGHEDWIQEYKEARASHYKAFEHQ